MSVFLCCTLIARTYLDPVQSTFNAPQVLLAVTNQAMRATAKPRGGDIAAACQFWSFHINVKVAGRTALEMMHPIIRYK